LSILIIDILYPGDSIKAEYYFYFLLAYFLFSFIRELFTVRLIELRFDPNNKTITLKSKKVITKILLKTIPFENSELPVDEKKPVFKWGTPLCIVYLFHNNREILKISTGKDGFTYKNINKIINHAASIPLTIIPV
jgi:hypothetical protein